MNYFIVILGTSLLFYLSCCYYETSYGHGTISIRNAQSAALLGIAACLFTMVAPLSLYPFGLGGLLLVSWLPYRKEEGILKRALLYTASTGISFLLVVAMRSLLIGWYDTTMCFLLVQGMLLNALLILQDPKCRVLWLPLIGMLLLFLLFVEFVWGRYHDDLQLRQSLPFLIFWLLQSMGRTGYRMQRSHDEILSMTNRRHMEKENQTLYEQLQKDNDIILRQMHDLRKEMRLLKESDTYEEVQEQILTKTQEFLSFRKTGNPLLDKILTCYQKDFVRLQIQVILDVEHFDEKALDAVDMCAIFCNLLENAMESCARCKDRVIQLKIHQEDNGYLFIKMKNSCDTVYQKGSDLLSMKEDALYHGYGLRNIQALAQRYEGDLHYEFDRKHHLFLTNVHLILPHVSTL